MKQWNTENGIQITQVLSGRSNAYLVCSESFTMLVDTGKAAAYKSLMRNIRAIVPQKSVDYLFLTHTHFDHCQSAARLQHETGCRIIVSEAAHTFIAEGYTPLPAGTQWFSKAIAKLGNAVGKIKFGYTPFTADVVVSGTTALHANSSFLQSISTPGHSVDCISLLVNGEIALVGDAMFGVFANSIFPPFADDVRGMILSWQALLATGCQYFLPGHGKAIHRTLVASELKKYYGKTTSH